MPHQLVSLLRDVSTELETLGHHAADQAAEARATALSITLEAVKAGIPPGKLRDLAVRLREEAASAADRLAHDRARVSLRIGQALARATTLAREADVLLPTRQRAAWLAMIVQQAAREVELAGEAAVDGVLVASVDASELALSDAVAFAEPDVIGVRVPRPGGSWRALIDWPVLEAAWMSGDPDLMVRALSGDPVLASPGGSGLQPRVWLVAGEVGLASSHREVAPDVELLPDEDSGVVEVGRRRIAVARVLPTLSGMADWRVLATAAPRLRENRPQTRRAGEVILFPGMR